MLPVNAVQKANQRGVVQRGSQRRRCVPSAVSGKHQLSKKSCGYPSVFIEYIQERDVQMVGHLDQAICLVDLSNICRRLMLPPLPATFRASVDRGCVIAPPRSQSASMELNSQ